MSIALVVIGNGRLDYLHAAIDSLDEHVGEHISHWLMVDDSGDATVRRELQRTYPDWTITHHAHNRGLAAAVNAGFDLVRETAATHILWWEEDFLCRKPLPIEDTITQLIYFPRIAQMMYRRQPLSPEETASGCVLRTLVDNSTRHETLDAFTYQDAYFSLNPCLIPRHIIDTYTWPAGPIGVGNETGFTSMLRAEGWLFGVWGHPGDDNVFTEHIGAHRGAKWQL